MHEETEQHRVKARERQDLDFTSGPQKGDFVAPPIVEEKDEAPDALPAQEEFWRPPVRFLPK